MIKGRKGWGASPLLQKQIAYFQYSGTSLHHRFPIPYFMITVKEVIDLAPKKRRKIKVRRKKKRRKAVTGGG